MITVINASKQLKDSFPADDLCTTSERRAKAAANLLDTIIVAVWRKKCKSCGGYGHS